MSVIQRKYATATVSGKHIRIPVVKRNSADFAVGGDWTPAAGDVKLSKDGGAQANIGTLPTYTNGAWQFQLTIAELTCKQLEIMVVDSATKAVEDQCILVETFGHASAMYQWNPQDAVRLGLTALPNAAADAAGGLPTTTKITDARLGVLTDWIDDGRLDLLLDAIPTTAMRGTDSAYTGTPPTAVAIATAVWASATRTLTSFGTLVADVWAYATRTLTQSAATTAAQVSGDTITLTRGDTMSQPITGLGSIATRSKLWFTVKAYPGDPVDTAALIQIEETIGLVYINGAAGTAGNGSITVDDEDDGDITIVLAAVESAKLVVRADRAYDIQMLTSAGVVETLTSGTFSVVEDVTRATS